MDREGLRHGGAQSRRTWLQHRWTQTLKGFHSSWHEQLTAAPVPRRNYCNLHSNTKHHHQCTQDDQTLTQTEWWANYNVIFQQDSQVDDYLPHLISIVNIFTFASFVFMQRNLTRQWRQSWMMMSTAILRQHSWLTDTQSGRVSSSSHIIQFPTENLITTLTQTHTAPLLTVTLPRFVFVFMLLFIVLYMYVFLVYFYTANPPSTLINGRWTDSTQCIHTNKLLQSAAEY